MDASTYVGTAALFEGDRLLSSGQAAMRGREAERLFPVVLDVVKRGGRGLRDVGEIRCGSGPGSFTSLRISASIAKGLAMGLGVGIRSVSSLGLIVAAAEPTPRGRFLAVLDALRGESYAQCFASDSGKVEAVGEMFLVPTDGLSAVARELEAEVVGPGLDGEWAPHARGALRLAASPVVDLPSWEPEYGRKAEAQVRWEESHGRSLAG